MLPFTTSSQPRRHAWGAIALVLFAGTMAQVARAADIIQATLSPREIAFARYVGFHREHGAVSSSGPVGVFIEASLPDLSKSAGLIGLRTPAENQPGRLQAIQAGGDGTVTQEVIERYWTVRQLMDRLPASTIAITPVNYKFHFAGEVKTGGTVAYVYDITPKKKRPGMVMGRIWIDAATGEEVLLSGHATKVPGLSGGVVNVVRETRLLNGSAFARISHISWTAPLVGRSELMIAEIDMNLEIVPRANSY